MDLKTILLVAGVHLCDPFSLMTGWVCHKGNHFGPRSATRFRRLTWRNGYTRVMTPQVPSESSAWRIFPRWHMMPNTKMVPPYKKDLKKHLRHRDRHVRQMVKMVRLLGKYLEPRVRHPSGRELRHHCRCNFIHPEQLSPFPERLKLPFPIDEILSGYEDIVSSSTDQFTTWVKTDPDATSVRHMVDVQKAVAEFREASERRHDTSSQAYRFDKNVPNRSPVQKRLSIYNWNPGPRRGKEDAFEKQIAGK